MKRINKISIALLVSALMVGSAFGHQGEMKFMFQFPDHLTPVLDGDMSDWDIVSDVYKIKAENHVQPVRRAHGSERLQCLAHLGLTHQRRQGLFFSLGCRRLHQQHREVVDDYRWDHSGGIFRGFDQGDDHETRYAMPKLNATIWPAQFSALPVIIPGYRWLQSLGGPVPLRGVGRPVLRGNVDTQEPAEMFGEYSIVPFDDIHPDGADQSVQHAWVEGTVVGIEVNWGDKDADPGSYDDAYWSGFGGVGASRDADQFGD